MTLAIAHTEGKTQILDVIRERRPPFSPEAVVEERESNEAVSMLGGLW
jgi:hypothetical protein